MSVVAALRQRPQLLFLLLAVYFIANVAVRLVLPHELELDEGQQLFLAQWLAVGYDSQPPLYNWLQYGAEQVLGPTLASLSVLKNLTLFASYSLFALTAAMVLRSRDLVIVATLGLLTMPQVSFEAQRDLTHTVAVIFAACLFFFALIRAIKSPNILNYALTGVAIGLGFIAKYNFVLLPAAAALAMLMDPEFRRRVLDWRVLVMVAVAAIVALPHGLWFLDHLDVATGRTIGKLTSTGATSKLGQINIGLFSLVAAAIGFSIITVVVFAIAFGRDLTRALSASSPWSRMIGRIMLITAAAIVLLIVFGGATQIKDRWLTPFFIVLPLYLCLKLEAAGVANERLLPRFMPIGIGAMVIIPLILLVRIPIHGMTGRYEKNNVPYGQAVQEIIASGPNKPSLILTSDQQMAGNIRLQEPDVPVMLPGYEAFLRPFAFDSTHPILVVWRNRGKADLPLPDGLVAWLSEHGGLAVSDINTVALPYHFSRSGDLYHFAYSYIYPKAE